MEAYFVSPPPLLYPIHHCTGLWVLVPFYSYNASYFLDPKVVLYAEGFHLSRGTLYFSKAFFEGLIFGGAYIRRGLSTE